MSARENNTQPGYIAVETEESIETPTAPGPLTDGSAGGGSRKKLVTRPGMAPPPVEYASWDMSVPLTVEETQSELLANKEASRTRSQFKTAPGGGANRISAGRSSAAVYVSLRTLTPETGPVSRAVAAIKVDEVVIREVRDLQTQPSLFRQRSSALVQGAGPIHWDQLKKGALAGILLGLLVTAAVVAFYPQGINSPGKLKPGAPAPHGEDRAKMPPQKKLQKERNALGLGPKHSLGTAEASSVLAPKSVTALSNPKDLQKAQSPPPSPPLTGTREAHSTKTNMNARPRPSRETKMVKKKVAKPSASAPQNDLWLE